MNKNLEFNESGENEDGHSTPEEKATHCQPVTNDVQLKNKFLPILP